MPAPPTAPEQPRKQRLTAALSYAALVAVFGVVLPRFKGLEFFDPQLLSAYACLGMVFAGPAAAQAFRTKPGTMAEAFGWILKAVLFGESIAIAMLVCGVATVYLTHRHSVFFPPDLAQLLAPLALGLAGSLALAAGAAWLALRFSAGVARGGLRLVFLAMLLLFFYRGQWLPSVAGSGALIALGAAAVFLGLLFAGLRNA